MIAIKKGPSPPGLVRAGEKHARELCARYDAFPDAYQDGRETLEARKSIYASKAVKSALEACHHGKCCYCEVLIPKPVAHSHVEHWRPKGRSRQARDEGFILPGYYWLAYSWDNLLLSCCVCNSTNKNDLFPLEDPATRARHHGMRLEDEMPSILKPDGTGDPSDQIAFDEDTPVGLTPLGRKTIEVLGLDSLKYSHRRKFLNEIRGHRQELIKLMTIDHPTAREIVHTRRKSIEEAVLPEKPFSAMVAAFLAANPLPEPITETTRSAGGAPFNG